MLCSNSYVKEIKKLNIDLHNKKVESKALDKILEDLNKFETNTKEICYPLGFNSIRNYYSRFFLEISKFSIIQDYVCKREGMGIVYKVLEELGYKEVENPFIIEVECADGKKEILSSSPEEKVFLKKENSLENYIAIFPENSKYYTIKGKQLLEEKMILPEDPVAFTIFYKLYRYNKKDFTDLVFLVLESPRIFERINEDSVRKFISNYSEATNIEEKIIINNIHKNLINLYFSLEKIKSYHKILKSGCCYSLEDLEISFSSNHLVLYLISLFLNKKEEIFSGYGEIERILEIIKKFEDK